MSLTAFLARLIGLFAMIVAVSVAMHKEGTLLTVGAIVESAPLLIILGFVGLAAGLAMVLSHNIWRGGLLTVLVTLAGWIILLRALAMLALPHQIIAEILNAVGYAQLFYVYTAIAFVIGAYMTIAGFRRA